MGFNIKKFSAVAIFTAGVFCLQAQPVAIKQQLLAVGSTATITISGFTSAQLDAFDNAPTNKPQPLNVGRLIDANYTPQTSGQWQKMSNGRIWRIKVVANDAKGISFFGKVNHLPKGAQLNIYTTDGSQWVNAFTNKDFSQQNILSSEIVKGQEAIIEYFEPNGVNDEPQFVIEKVGYMYRTERNGDTPSTDAFGTSGACNVNVKCREGDGWAYQKNAVARIRCLTDFTVQWCTGTLMHNTNKDFKPYMLTAMHCALDGTGKSLINDTLFKYWLFYFNYESPTCANPFSEDTLADRVITGSRVLAHSDDQGGEKGSDFLLVELNQKPPQNWNPYYAGWNLDTVAQMDSGVCIHHPAWDIKKISTYKWPPSFNAPFSTSPDNTHWEVLWSATANGHGITQGGSSGAVLFDNNGYAIGTLTGGNSSCSTPGNTDFFGRMDWHFTRNGIDSTRQLKHWLDPMNTGIKKFGGEAEYPLSVEKVKPFALEFYPNPANETITFSSPYISNTSAQVQILNVLGQQFYSMPNSNNTIDISALPQGVYFISIKQKNNYFTAKFIKQ